MNEKLEKLKAILGDCGSAVIAFSGGLDSTFLAKPVDRDALISEIQKYL